MARQPSRSGGSRATAGRKSSADADDLNGVPRAACRRLDLALVELGGHRTRRHARKFGEDRAQGLGALLCFGCSLEALRIGAAELQPAIDYFHPPPSDTRSRHYVPRHILLRSILGGTHADGSRTPQAMRC